MSFIKTSLRSIIAVTSVLSFLGGWALFSHSQKPAGSTNTQAAASSVVNPLPTLAPLPTLDFSSNTQTQLQPLPAQPAFAFRQSMGRLRTGGS
jgi:hypothetical protein